MEPGNAEAMSSLEIVKEFLESLRGPDDTARKPTSEELRRIRPALDELVAKITRLHRISPAFARATLSDEVKELVRAANGPEGWLRIAALF